MAMFVFSVVSYVAVATMLNLFDSKKSSRSCIYNDYSLKVFRICSVVPEIFHKHQLLIPMVNGKV